MEPQAWMNGTWAAEAETRLPLDDAMVTHGAGLVEVLRTWSGVPVFLNRHLDRFIRAAGEMGLRLPVTGNVLASLVTEYLHRLPASLAGKDRHVVLLATPGSPGQRSATLVIHGRALDTARHRDYMENGVALTRSKVKALPLVRVSVYVTASFAPLAVGYQTSTVRRRSARGTGPPCGARARSEIGRAHV